MAEEMIFGIRITGDPGGAVKAVDQAVSAVQKLDAKLKSMANRVISGAVSQPTQLGNIDQLGTSKDIAAWQTRQELELARQRMESAKQHYQVLKEAADKYYQNVQKQEQKVDAIRKQLEAARAKGGKTARLEQSYAKQSQILERYQATYLERYQSRAVKAEQAVHNAVVTYAKKATQVVKQEKAAQEAAAKKSSDNQIRNLRRPNSEAQRLSKNIGQGAMLGINQTITALGSIGNSFRLVTQGFSELGRVLTTFLALPLGGLFALATRTAIDFEAAIVRVGKTTGLEGAKLQALTDWIREFSLTTASSQTDLAIFAEQLGQLGVTDTNAMSRLIATVEMMANATELSADEVTKSMGRIATAFGYDLNTEEGVRSIERLSNVINKLENTTAASAGEIIEGLLNVASVGGMLDIPVQDMAAIVAQMESMSVASDAVGNRVTRFFQQLITKSADAAKFLKGFNVVAEDGVTILRSYSGDEEEFLAALNKDKVQVLNDFMDALSRVPAEQSTQAMAQWFDLVGQVGGKVGVLAGNVKGLGSALRTAREEWEKSNSLFEEYDKALMTTESHLKILRNNLNNAAITVGDTFLPVLNRLIEYAVPGIQILTAAFKSLSWETKVLAVAIPLIAMVLAPLLFIFSQLGHAVGMLFMGFQTVFVLARNVGVAMFSLGKTIFSVAKLFKVLAAGGTLAAGALTGGLAPALLTVVAALAGIAGAVGLAVVGLKTLQSRGVDVAGFFNNLAERARNWGENMMATYANGLIGGAAKYVAKAISTIAQWIANFFEAHSPPKEGPLSDIDKWGGPLFSTFLRGFYLADFSILEGVGNIVRGILQKMFSGDDMEGTVAEMVSSARTALAELINIFNETGEISQELLDKISAGAGHLADDVEKLVTLWLEYEATQRRIKELEEQRAGVEKAYSDEVAAIAASNLSAEEKAAKIREAIYRKNEAVDAIEDQIDAEEDKADALKEQVDWQEAFLQAQLDQADLFDKIADSLDKVGSALEDLGGLFEGGLGGGSNGDPVDPFKDLETTIKKRLESAKMVIKEFLKGLFGGEKSSASILHYMGIDDETIAEMEKAYDFGKKIYDFFFGKKEKTDPPPSPFQNWLGEMGEFLGNLLTIDDSFAEVGASFARIGTAIQNVLGRATGGTLTWSDVLGWLVKGLGFFAQFIAGVVVGAINLFGTVLEWAAKIIEGVFVPVIYGVRNAIKLFVALKDVVVGLFKGLFTGDWSQFQKGIKDTLLNLGMLIGNLVSAVIKGIGGLLLGAGDIVLGLLRDLFVTVADIIGQAFGVPDLGEKVRKVFDDIRGWIDNAWNDLLKFFDTIARDFTGFISDLFGGGKRGGKAPGAAKLLPDVDFKTWFTINKKKAQTWLKKFFNNVGAAVEKLGKKAWESLKDWWGKHVKPRVDELKNRIKSWFDGLVQKAKEQWDTFAKDPLKALSDWWGKVVEPKFTELWKSISGWFTNTLIPWVKTKWEEFRDGPAKALAKWWETTVSPFFSNLWTSISGWFINTLLPLAQKKWDEFKSGPGKALVSWWETTVSPFFSSLWTGISGWFTSTLLPWAAQKWEEFKKGPGKALTLWWTNTVAPKFETLWSNMSLWFTTTWNTVKTKWEEFRDSPIKALTSWWTNVVKPFFDELWKGISGWFENTLKPLFTGNWKDVKTNSGKSLSGWWNEMKSPFDGLWKGISSWFMDTALPFVGEKFTEMRGLPITSLTDWWLAIKPLFDAVFGGVTSWFTTTMPQMRLKWDFLRNTFQTSFDLLPGMVGTVFTALLNQPVVVSALGIAYSMFEQAGRNFAGSVAKGLQSMAGEAASAMGGIVGDMIDQINSGIEAIGVLADAINSLNNMEISVGVPSGGGSSSGSSGSSGSGGSNKGGNKGGKKGGGNVAVPMASGGIALGPTLALIAEGKEPEAVIPLSRLPDLVRSSMPIPENNYFKVEINNPQVRDDDDIRKLVYAVRKEMTELLREQQRMRGRR